MAGGGFEEDGFPDWAFEGAGAGVLEELADGEEEDTGEALGVEADVEVEAIVEEEEAAVADHVEADSFHQEIVGCDDAVADDEGAGA